jgi:hypothetical protein
MDEIEWHRRESRRQTENTNFVLQLRETPASELLEQPANNLQASLIFCELPEPPLTMKEHVAVRVPFPSAFDH